MTRTAALKQQWPHHDQQKQHAATTPSMLCAGPLPLCSVCLEMVRDDGGGRAIAKLKCGHQFHLDCIGSAFNSKGTMQCPNCRQVEDGEWLYANGCCRYYEEEAIHRNFVYAQDADQSYQPGQAAIHVPMYPQQQFNYLHHHCHPQLSLSFENIEWVPGGDDRFSYSIDVILTVCLGEHGNMRSATYIHLYADGDGKSLLMCTEDRQTFPPIETPAIPLPAMPATPQLVDQMSNNHCVSLVELTHVLFSISLFL